MEFGMRWEEWNRKGELVTKEKFFKTQKAVDKAFEKLENKDNFNGIISITRDNEDVQE